jgi:hypothetical protein
MSYSSDDIEYSSNLKEKLINLSVFLVFFLIYDNLALIPENCREIEPRTV